MKTHYAVLGVADSATPQEIRAAYRKLVKAHHPDTASGQKSPARVFEEISAAYSILMNPEKRREYDKELATRKPANNKSTFSFREMKQWLFSAPLLKLLFGTRKVAPAASQSQGVKSLSIEELLERVLYSPNVHVQIAAVRAIVARGKNYAVKDLLRLLYSNLNENVKVEIIKGLAGRNEKAVQTAIAEIAAIEKSLRVREALKTLRAF